MSPWRAPHTPHTGTQPLFANKHQPTDIRRSLRLNRLTPRAGSWRSEVRGKQAPSSSSLANPASDFPSTSMAEKHDLLKQTKEHRAQDPVLLAPAHNGRATPLIRTRYRQNMTGASPYLSYYRPIGMLPCRRCVTLQSRSRAQSKSERRRQRGGSGARRGSYRLGTQDCS